MVISQQNLISDFLRDHQRGNVKDFEFIADQNKQHNYKPPPIKFINIFLWFRYATDPKENKRLQICLPEPAASSI